MDTVLNVCEIIAENVDFVENSKFIRGSTVAVVHINRALTQVFSCEGTFSQNTPGQLLLELVSENNLKTSCYENYINLSC